MGGISLFAFFLCVELSKLLSLSLGVQSSFVCVICQPSASCQAIQEKWVRSRASTNPTRGTGQGQQKPPTKKRHQGKGKQRPERPGNKVPTENTSDQSRRATGSHPRAETGPQQKKRGPQRGQQREAPKQNKNKETPSTQKEKRKERKATAKRKKKGKKAEGPRKKKKERRRETTPKKKKNPAGQPATPRQASLLKFSCENYFCCGCCP